MRAIVFTSLLLVLISLAGCQSNSVSYHVESNIGPLTDTNQHLVCIKIIEVRSSGNRTVASPSCFVMQGQEQKMSVENKARTMSYDCNILIGEDKSITSVSVSKKGKVFWSSEQTTIMSSKG
jgi:hypothetical protein